MLTNGCVSLYHYNEAARTWRRSFFPSASIYRRFSSSSSTGSFAPENYCVIRIPDHASSDISIGDYIYIGNILTAEPDFKLCLKVTSFCRNNRGRSPHLKIICS